MSDDQPSGRKTGTTDAWFGKEVGSDRVQDLEAKPSAPEAKLPMREYTNLEDVGSVNKEGLNRDLVVGGLWLFGGLIVTGVTYSSASNGGGSYVVAWGAILFGGIQFLKGLAKAL